MKEIHPLLRLSPLLPAKSLPSLLTRLAKLNYYPSINTLLQLCRENLSQPDTITQPAQTKTYEVLAALVRIKVDDLYVTSVHRFAAILNQPTQESPLVTLPTGQAVPLLTDYSRRQLLWTESSVQFCPVCLNESAYHRIHWFPRVVTVCLSHQCLLVHDCPHCGQDIRIANIIERRCRRCDFELNLTPITSLAEDSFGLFSQAVIQFWLVAAPQPASCPLPDQPPAVLHYFLFGLYRSIISLIQGPWPYLHAFGTIKPPSFPLDATKQIDPAEAYLLYTTAMKAVINWPQGFYDFMDAVKQQDNRPPDRTIPKDFQELLTYWLSKNWRHPSFQFVQKAFDDYMLNDPRVVVAYDRPILRIREAGLEARFPYMTIQQAAELLHLSPRGVKYLIELGVISRYELNHAHPFIQKHIFVIRSEVLELEQRWTDGLSLTEAAQIAGTSEDLLRALIHNQLIELIPKFRQNGNIRLPPESLEYLLRKANSQILDDMARNINAPKVVELLQKQGFGVVSVLEYGLAGELWRLTRDSSDRINSVELFDKDIVTISGEIRLKPEGNPATLQDSTLMRPLKKWIDPDWLATVLPHKEDAKH